MIIPQWGPSICVYLFLILSKYPTRHRPIRVYDLNLCARMDLSRIGSFLFQFPFAPHENANKIDFYSNFAMQINRWNICIYHAIATGAGENPIYI